MRTSGVSCGRDAGACRRGRKRSANSLRSQSPPVCSSIRPMVDRNDQEVELAHPADRGRLGAAFDDVDRRDGEALAGARVALAAGLGQVLRVDGRLSDRTRPGYCARRGNWRNWPRSGCRILAARPWKEASKLTSRSAGMPNLRESRTLPWQLPQVSRMWPALTGESALVCFRMECSPWQSVQSGACAMPRARAWPCTLARYWSTTSVWHIPQVSGTAVRKAWDFGRSSSCALPWQSAQSGAPSLPFLRGLAVHALLVVGGLIGVAGGAGRFGDVPDAEICRGIVAGVAGQGGMRALGDFLPLFVAGGAVGRRVMPAATEAAPAAPRKGPRAAEPSLRPRELNARFTAVRPPWKLFRRTGRRRNRQPPEGREVRQRRS